MKIIQIQNNHNVNDDRPEFDRALIASLPASSRAILPTLPPTVSMTVSAKANISKFYICAVWAR